MERLVEVSEQEVRIDFALNCKRRANVRLRSLITATPIAFKIQTSSPHKFLVKPPCGLIQPLSYATFTVILKPQSQMPPTFPRSPSDRFLIKIALAPEFTHNSSESTHPESINSWFSSRPHDSITHEVKLKVAFVGPLLLFHAVGHGNIDAVRNLVKRQKSVVSELTCEEAESLLRVAAELDNSDDMVSFLVDVGLKSNNNACRGLESKGPTELQVSSSFDRMDHFSGPAITTNDLGRPAVNFARDAHKEAEGMVEGGEMVLNAARIGDVKNLEFLLRKGATMNYSDQYGLTPLHVAAIKGHKEVVSLLVGFGSNLECEDNEGHSPLHLAVEGGSIGTVEALINNGANVNAKSKRGATPLYLARAMGYDDISELLLRKGASALRSSSASSLSSM